MGMILHLFVVNDTRVVVAGIFVPSGHVYLMNTFKLRIYRNQI